MFQKNKKSSILFFAIIIVMLLIVSPIILNQISKPGYLCRDCNLILISITNIGAKHTSLYGYYRNTTPELDAFAKNAIVFENAFTHSSWTLPSGISLFSSQYPYTHGVMSRLYGKKLNSSTETLVDLLRSSGYTTAASTGGFDYSPRYGLVNRFFYNLPQNTTIRDFHLNQMHLNFTIPEAINWLAQNKDEKFFLFIQGYDAHCPFIPPQPYDNLFNSSGVHTVNSSYCVRGYPDAENEMKIYKAYYHLTGQDPISIDENDVDYLVSQYDGEIAYVDSTLSSLLNYLENSGLLQNTIVVITSEHGEMFAKYGRFGRAGTLRGTHYDDVVRIPLIVYHPKLSQARVNGLVQLIDVMPTLLDFLGVRTPSSAQGKSLVPLILEGNEVNEYVLMGSRYGRADATEYNLVSINEAIRSKEWKLIREIIFEENTTEKLELYHIKKDKDELNNLVGSRKDVLEILYTKLSEWSNSVKISIE